MLHPWLFAITVSASSFTVLAPTFYGILKPNKVCIGMLCFTGHSIKGLAAVAADAAVATRVNPVVSKTNTQTKK